MPHSIPTIEARKKFTSLSETLQSQPELGVIAVTRHGQPVLAVMSWEFYETLLETIQIMSDKKLTLLLREGIKDANVGRVKPWKTIKKELCL